MKKTLIGIAIFAVAISVFFYFKNKTQSPIIEIGEKVEDQGRDHVTDIYGVTYKSNPPTSGPHFPVWAKQGLYTQLISDGYFIHSMEHGYIVIWYNCDKLNSTYKFVPEVLAHGDEEIKASTDSGKMLMHMTVEPKGNITWITPETQPGVEVKLPMSFETQSCKSFVEDLKPFLNTEDRVIIAPRVNLESKLIITAWNRIFKLDSIDKNQIENFIKTYHNKGPEKTME